MTQYLSPLSGIQENDENGTPRVGCKLFTYVAGSSTKTTVTKDQSGLSNHSNPIILNARGEPADGSGVRQAIWQSGGINVKYVLAPASDTDPPLSPIWTIDNVSGINDLVVTSSEWNAGPSPTYISSTSFSVEGDQTTEYHIGRRIKTYNTSGTVYSTIVNSAYSSVTTITVLNDSGSIDSGLSQLFLAGLSKNNHSIPITSFESYGQCLLTKVTTNLVLQRFNGRFLSINGSSYSIPSAGVSLAPTSLAASTVYYIYAYMNSGTMTLEASTTAYATDATTGLKIKTGDSTRTLVGMGRTDGAVAWEANQRSWFNDPGYTAVTTFSVDRSTTSVTAIEINSEIRNGFLSWTGEPVLATVNGSNQMNVFPNTIRSLLAFNTTAQSGIAANYMVDVNLRDFSVQANNSLLTEGYNYATLYGLVSANQGTWSSSTTALRVHIGPRR